MAKSTWKQWTVEEKLKILNFCDEHSAIKAVQNLILADLLFINEKQI